MEPIVLPEIEKYAEQHSSRLSPLFDELAEVTRQKTTLPQMMVGHLEGAFLRFLVRATAAKRVLEIGTFTGYSALAMAEALPDSGELITCDINPDTTDIAKSFWARSPHGKKIHAILGPAVQSIKSLSGPFDLVFIDADKENYLNYWEAVLPLVRQGGVIAVDNTLWSGRVLKPQSAADVAIVEFNRKAVQDKRVESVLATIRDGVFLAWKK